MNIVFFCIYLNTYTSIFGFYKLKTKMSSYFFLYRPWALTEIEKKAVKAKPYLDRYTDKPVLNRYKPEKGASLFIVR